MTSTGPTPVAEITWGSQIASAAQRALECDAFLITRRAGDGGAEIAVAKDMSTADARAILPWLDEIEVGVGDAAQEVVLPPAIAELGIRSAAVAAARMEGARRGTVHVFYRRERVPDLTLLQAFAAHCGVLLAHAGLQRGPDSLARQVERTQALDRLLPSVSDFAELVPQIDAALFSIFGTIRCGVMTWDDEAEVLQLVPGSFGLRRSATASYQVTPEDTHSNAARVFSLGRPYLSNDAQHDPGVLSAYAEAFGIRRVLTVPLVVGGRTIGVLHVADKEADFTLEDLQELEGLAPRIAVAVDMTRLLLRTRRQQRLEAVLAEVATKVARGEAGAHSLREGLVEMLAITGTNTIVLTPAGAPPISATVNGDGTGSLPILVAQARGLQGERADVASPRGAGDPGSAILHVPIRLGVRRLGTLSACRTRGERFDVEERIAFARLGNLASLAWAADEVAAQQGQVARLEERQRIADDLHDDVAQLLFAAQMQLEDLSERPELDPEVVAPVARARALITRGDAAIRDVIEALSPPPPGDLADQLRKLAEGIEEEFTLPIGVEITARGREAAEAVHDQVKDTVARVARESLVNVAKHAGPCQATLRLDARAGSLVVEVEDDGVGIDEDGAGGNHGLGSLRRAVARRGGWLEVRRRAGGGTSVAASLPLP